MIFGSHIKIWNLANHMKKWNKEHQTFSFQFFSNRFSVFFLKSTQYKKLAPNSLWFTHWNLKSCKPHEKQKQKSCSFLHFINVICKISNFDMWIAKHLVQASWTELSLNLMFKSQVDVILVKVHFFTQFTLLTVQPVFWAQKDLKNRNSYIPCWSNVGFGFG